MKTITPVCDFVKRYAKGNPVRLHVPGHKGKNLLGFEKFDITEIDGADELYNSKGIIAQSEEIAGGIFGCPTFYSAEGSSLSIRAMVYLATLWAKNQGKKPVFLASRNAHKSFLTAVGLCGAFVEWLDGEFEGSMLKTITCTDIENHLKTSSDLPCAVYLTSPDYFGNIVEVKSIAEVCKKQGVLLIIDCAHGGYFKFLSSSLFPIDLGADMCCVSAHKTLPAITGGAYLHLSPTLPKEILSCGKKALSVFGSTSPSYLILQSLDYCNKLILDGFNDKVLSTAILVSQLKKELATNGYILRGSEPLKICINAKSVGYTGYQLKDYLKNKGIIIEYCDEDYLVMMFTPYLTKRQIDKVKRALLGLPKRPAIKVPTLKITKKVVGKRIADLLTAPTEQIRAKNSLGRVYAQIDLPCPPATPILAWGEIIDENAIEIFNYFNIEYCTVIKE